MKSSQLITSVGDACDLAGSWLGITEDLSGPDLGDANYPSSVKVLNSRFGRLWHSTDHGVWKVLNSPTCPLHLLEYQDVILPPMDYQIDSDGVIDIVWENQGVWGFGYRPPDVDSLWVTGDWSDGIRTEFSEKWRPIQAHVDDCIIFTLVSNLCIFASTSADWGDPRMKRPAETDLLVWRHPAWKGFAGFWLDRAFTTLHYSGMGLTVRR